eukprot:m.116340 g.116340  ORF g.116340 m.116340 type:complete len:186 (-) comp13130_c1_seq6:186-743(-)
MYEAKTSRIRSNGNVAWKKLRPVLMLPRPAGGSAALPTCHPLDVARSNHIGVAHRVCMLHLTLQRDCDGLKSSVRVHSNTQPLHCRRKLLRRGVVEHEKGGDGLGEGKVGEHGVDMEPIANPCECPTTPSVLRSQHARCKRAMLVWTQKSALTMFLRGEWVGSVSDGAALTEQPHIKIKKTGNSR